MYTERNNRPLAALVLMVDLTEDEMKLTDRQTEIAAYHADLAAAFLARRCGCGAQADCVVVGCGATWDRNCCLPCMGRIVSPDGAVLRSEGRPASRERSGRQAAKGGSVTGPPLVYQETP